MLYYRLYASLTTWTVKSTPYNLLSIIFLINARSIFTTTKKVNQMISLIWTLVLVIVILMIVGAKLLSEASAHNQTTNILRSTEDDLAECQRKYRAAQRALKILKKREKYFTVKSNILAAQKSRLQVLATRDAQTGLLNARAFESHVSADLARFKRIGEDKYMAMLFCDANNFKEVNDCQGHAAGDKVLALLAQVMLDTVRESDIVGRIGGDEFGILLNDVAGVDSVESFTKRLSDAWNVLRKTHDICANVSLSIGVYVLPHDQLGSITVQDMVRCADVLMYKAKQEKFTQVGKNVFSTLVESPQTYTINEE
jgi:diguanylate cyclase (GGDEF)-like protein